MTNDSSSLTWAVPCDQEHTFEVLVGGNTYRIKKEQLISLDSTGTVCTSLVKGWADSSVHAYLFGAPFASTAYIAYNAYQDQSGDQIGFAPRSTEDITVVNEGVSKGVLIGAIVGSVGFTAILICFIVFFFWYRRRRAPVAPKPQDGTPNDEKYKIEPFTAGVSGVPNSATPILPATTRQNGWIIEQGPIGGEPSEGSVFSHERTSMLRSPQNDSKRLTQSSQLLSVRHSQFTESVATPMSATSRPSPSVDHSFHESRVHSSYGIPESQHGAILAEDEPAPPPYQPGRDEANTRATGSASRQKN